MYKRQLQAEVARGAGGGRSGEATARDPTSSPAVPTSGLATQTGTSQLTLSRPTLTELRPPKYDSIEAHFGMWRRGRYPLHYGGGWVQEPPPRSDGCSHDQTNDGSCVPTFNPHLLTAQFAQKDKDGRSGIFGGNGREQWVADSGATFHVTGNPVGMVECKPPPPDRSTLVVSDMKSLRVQCFGKLPLIMHSKHGDVQVKLLDVAYVPGVRLSLIHI